MTTQTATACWSDAEEPLNNLDALLWMAFEHVGTQVHENTGDLKAMHVFQCLRMAIDQADAIGGVLDVLDAQSMQEADAKHVSKVMRVA